MKGKFFFFLVILSVLMLIPLANGQPQIVCPQTQPTGLSYPPQNKGFMARGYAFIFCLSSAGNIYYTSSRTGLTGTWSNPVWCVVDAGTTANGFNFDIEYDNETYFSNGTISSGGYAHLVWLSTGQTENNRVFYKRGNVTSDGAILWNTDQIVLTYSSPSSYWCFPSINLDSDGRVYISACWSKWIPAYGNVTITRNANLNETWTTDAGYPYKIQDVAVANPVPSKLIGLDNKRMMIVWANLSRQATSNTQLLGSWYNGSIWSTPTYATPNYVIYASDRWTITRDSNEDCIIAYIQSLGSTVSARYQNSSGIWLTFNSTRDEITSSSGTTMGGEISWRTDNDYLYYVDINTPTIRYFVYNSTIQAWNTTANTFDIESGNFGGSGNMRYHCLFPISASNGTYLTLGHAYINGSTEYLKYHWLTFTPATIPSPPSGGNYLYAMFNYNNSAPYQGQDTVLFNGTLSNSSGVISSYLWDFGDSNTSTGNTTTHIYLSDGVFTVNLTVVSGSMTNTMLQNITVLATSINISIDWNDLLFGSGAWIPLIITIAVMFVLVTWNRYAVVAALPIMAILSLLYFTNTTEAYPLIWHGLIMLCSGIIILIYSAAKK